MLWKIAEMSIAHLEQVMQIEKFSFLTPWTKDMFSSEFRSPHSFHFVAYQRQQQSDLVLCYIIFWMFLGEVHVLNLATHPDYRRLGIARSLLLFTIDFSYQRGALLYLLEAREGNQAAINLYRQMGFSSWSVRKKYYSDTNEDAVVMGLFYGGRIYGKKDKERSRIP